MFHKVARVASLGTFNVQRDGTIKIAQLHTDLGGEGGVPGEMPRSYYLDGARKLDVKGLLGKVAGLQRGAARYDLALVLLAEGKATAAREILSGVSETLSAGRVGAERGALLSMVQTRSAQASLMEGDRPAGRRAVSRALSLDPANSVARLLARKLEAGREQ